MDVMHIFHNLESKNWLPLCQVEPQVSLALFVSESSLTLWLLDKI